MTEAHPRAVALAQHYFRQIAEQAGMAWDGDNNTEVELMISYVIDAAADRLHGQLDDALERIRELEDGLRDALNRIHALEDRQSDYADEEHEPEPVECDPGPEVDDEGGMSEYRGWLP